MLEIVGSLNYLIKDINPFKKRMYQSERSWPTIKAKSKRGLKGNGGLSKPSPEERTSYWGYCLSTV